MRKKVLICILVTVFSACAQEKHPPSHSHPDPNVSLHEVGSDCSIKFKNSGLCVSYVWEKMPTETEEGSFTFKTYRQNVLDQTPVLTALAQTPTVVLWMTSMGHGSSPIQVDTIDTGTYRASHVYLVMPGVWQIRFQQKSQETVKDEAVVSFTF